MFDVLKNEYNYFVNLIQSKKKKVTLLTEGSEAVSRFVWDTGFESLEEKALEQGALKWTGLCMIYICLDRLGDEGRQEDIWTTCCYIGKVSNIISVETNSGATKVEEISDIFAFLQNIRKDDDTSSSAGSTTDTSAVFGANSQSIQNVLESNTPSQSGNGSSVPQTPKPVKKKRPSLDEPEKTTESKKPKREQKPKKVKVVEKSKKELELDEMNSLVSRISRFSTELKDKSAKASRRVPFKDLAHDFTIRNLNQAFVKDIVRMME
uniref:Uncharacterized protein n=1 Tax=Panagrolaimus superbus TaxID=310955 RepID=A0A914YA82_9BILA